MRPAHHNIRCPARATKRERMEETGTMDTMCHLRRAFEAQDPEYTDCEVMFCGETLRLHKLILSTCAYFRAAFSHEWTSAGTKGAFGVDAVVLDTALVCPGTEKDVIIPCVRSAIGSLYGIKCAIDCTNWQCLLQLGAFLGLPKVLAACEIFAIQEIDAETVIPLANTVSQNEYGHTGRRILDACTLFLHRNAIEMGTSLQHLHFPLLCTLLSSPNLYSPTECHRINLLCALIQSFAVADGTTVEQLSSLQQLMRTACRMEFVALDDLKALAAHYNRPSISGSVICLPLGPAETPRVASQDSPTSITATTLSASPESVMTLRSFRFAGEFTELVARPKNTDFAVDGSSVITIVYSSPLPYAGALWCLEARKHCAITPEYRVKSTVSIFLKRCASVEHAGIVAAEGERGTPISAKFSIRMLGQPGTCLHTSVVGQASEPKVFTLNPGEEKWGWHRFMEWEDEVASGDAGADVDTDALPSLRFVAVVEAVTVA